MFALFVWSRGLYQNEDDHVHRRIDSFERSLIVVEDLSNVHDFTCLFTFSLLWPGICQQSADSISY